MLPTAFSLAHVDAIYEFPKVLNSDQERSAVPILKSVGLWNQGETVSVSSRCRSTFVGLYTLVHDVRQ